MADKKKKDNNGVVVNGSAAGNAEPVSGQEGAVRSKKEKKKYN